MLFWKDHFTPLHEHIICVILCVYKHLCYFRKKLYTSSTQQQTISVCVIVVCMPSPLYLAVCNPCMSVLFFIRKKNYTSFTQQTISVRGIVVCTPLYLASCSPYMCVRAVSIFLYKKHVSSIM